jgi:hypothetical protein
MNKQKFLNLKVAKRSKAKSNRPSADPFGLPRVKDQPRPFKMSPPASTSTLRDTVPDTVHLPLRYSDNFDLVGAVISDQVINLNSIFDPDRTGVGHQPLGYDQWALFYNRYLVETVDMKIDFVNISANSTSDVLVHCSNDATAITTVAQFQANTEAPYSESNLVSSITGINYWSVSRRISLNSITGVTAEKYRTDDVYQAQFGSNPSEVLALHICAKDFSFTTNISMKVRVTLTFWCMLFDRLQLTISSTSKKLAVKDQTTTEDDEKDLDARIVDNVDVFKQYMLVKKK